MITFIIGQRNMAFQKALDKAVLGVGEVERVRLNAENILRTIEDSQSPSLFGDVKVFVISDLFEDAEVKEKFWESGAALRAAPHNIIVIAESILAADLKKAESIGTVTKILEKNQKAARFDPFVLGNAFAAGDKKQSWIALQEIIAAGDEMEPTHGIIWWKLKDMMQKRSGFSDDQLKSMARNLVAAYHESRLGGLNLAQRLELFFLNLPMKK